MDERSDINGFPLVTDATCGTTRADSPPMLRSTLLAGIGVVALGGCLGGAGLEATDGSGIVRGQVEPGHPEVGVLYSDGAFCTATLIASRVLLTARHCIPDGQNAGDIRFFTGQVVDWENATPAAVGVEIYDYWDSPLAPGYTYYGDDIAAVILDRDPPGISPAPYRTRPMGNDVVGQQVQLVGYGETQLCAKDHGTRRSTSATIVGMFSNLSNNFQVKTRGGADGGEACRGDSGGPIFLEGEVAGVITGTDCASRSYHQRVDIHIDLIQSAIDRAASFWVGRNTTYPERYRPLRIATCDGNGGSSSLDDGQADGVPPGGNADDEGAGDDDGCDCDSYFTDPAMPLCCDVDCACDTDCDAGYDACDAPSDGGDDGWSDDDGCACDSYFTDPAMPLCCDVDCACDTDCDADLPLC